jgi:hypothetical protein
MRQMICGFSFLIAMLCNLSSCEKESKCNCTEEFDSMVTYVPGDYASYNDTCWHAYFQGRGVRPGSEKDDVWEFCSEH